MRSRKSVSSITRGLLLLVLALIGGNAGAQEAPAPAASKSPAGASEPQDQKQASDDKGPDAAPPPGPAAAKGSPQRFEPSERVRPDFDVAFPVDI
jgi:hypothetical protein